MGNRNKKENSITDSLRALTITPCQENSTFNQDYPDRTVYFKNECGMRQ